LFVLSGEPKNALFLKGLAGKGFLESNAAVEAVRERGEARRSLGAEAGAVPKPRLSVAAGPSPAARRN
jgi:hypothetical protein